MAIWGGIQTWGLAAIAAVAVATIASCSSNSTPATNRPEGTSATAARQPSGNLGTTASPISAAPTSAEIGEATLAPCGGVGFTDTMRLRSGGASVQDESVRYEANVEHVEPVSGSDAALVVIHCEFVGAGVSATTWLGVVAAGPDGNFTVQGRSFDIPFSVRTESSGDQLRVTSDEFAPNDGTCCASATDTETFEATSGGAAHLSPVFRTPDEAVVADVEQAGIVCDELLGMSHEQWTSLTTGIDYLAAGRGPSGHIVITRMINPPDAVVLDRVMWVDSKFETTIDVPDAHQAVLYTDPDDGEQVCSPESGPGD